MKTEDEVRSDVELFLSRLPRGAELVARAELARALNESPGTLANRDSTGNGISRVTIGTRVFYRLVDIVRWLETRIGKGNTQ